MSDPEKRKKYDEYGNTGNMLMSLKHRSNSIEDMLVAVVEVNTGIHPDRALMVQDLEVVSEETKVDFPISLNLYSEIMDEPGMGIAAVSGGRITMRVTIIIA